MRNEEKVIKFLLNEFPNSTNNIVSVNKNDLPTIGLTEKETIQALYLLEDDGLIDIVKKSVHNNFSIVWKIHLNPSCIHYFADRKSKFASNRRDWIRTYLPLSISIISLLKSYQAEITLALETVLKVIKQVSK